MYIDNNRRRYQDILDSRIIHRESSIKYKLSDRTKFDY